MFLPLLLIRCQGKLELGPLFASELLAVCPARMYILVIFACIGTLMKCSALKLFVIAVYGGIRGIYNGKSWMKIKRLFQSVAASFLQRFLSIRQKAFDGVEQYSKELISNCSTLHGQFSSANTPDSRVWAHRVRRRSPIETAEDEVSDEEILPRWICQLFT